MSVIRLKNICLYLLILAFSKTLSAQTDTLKTTSARKTLVFTTIASSYTATGVLLNKLWYANTQKTKFHFFNDNNEWLQMDKAGHAFSTYFLNFTLDEMFLYAGYSQKKATILSATISTVSISSIEIFDGFSKNWGASSGDLIANICGSLLYSSQNLLWNEQKLMLKFSFYPTPYPNYRKQILGKNLTEQIIKDYNGQTYWLCINPSRFFTNENKILPEWLCFSLGYGVDGLIGGHKNPGTDEQGKTLPTFNRTRELYLSLDVDWQKINIKSKTLKKFLYVLNFVKMPLPAVEYKTNGRFYVRVYK